jgi:hypothetical protein
MRTGILLVSLLLLILLSSGCTGQTDARGGLEVVVIPMFDETVKGTITVEVMGVPEGTEYVKFFLYPQDITLGPNMAYEDISRVKERRDISMSDVWSASFDTTEVENGQYKIFVGSTYEGASDQDPWHLRRGFRPGSLASL